jgi:hypothetical protein
MNDDSDDNSDDNLDNKNVIMTRSKTEVSDSDLQHVDKKRKRITPIHVDEEDDAETDSDDDDSEEDDSDDDSEEDDSDDDSDEDISSTKIGKMVHDALITGMVTGLYAIIENHEDDDDDDEDDEDDDKVKDPKAKDSIFDELKDMNLSSPEAKYIGGMTPASQLRVKDAFIELKTEVSQIIPERIRILQSDLNHKSKEAIIKRLDDFNQTSNRSGSSEHDNEKRIIREISRVPFGVYDELQVDKSHNLETINEFIIGFSKRLNERVYGQRKAKCELIQMICQWISNPSTKGTIIGLKGPPGIGKTLIVKEGLSYAIGRPCVYIQLGGLRSPEELTGFSSTFVGAQPGRIVKGLQDSKCMNPIFLFDELDKVCHDEHGKGVMGVLTHMTDKTQNDVFEDEYFASIDFDISKCLFVFTFNDIELVDPILKDRMVVIDLKGFDTKQKIIIGKKYSLVKIMKDIGLSSDDVIVTDEILEYIIQQHTGSEEGVRTMERILHQILSRVNVLKFITQSTKHSIDDLDLPFELKKKITFPLTLDRELIDILRNDSKLDTEKWHSLYM